MFLIKTFLITKFDCILKIVRFRDWLIYWNATSGKISSHCACAAFSPKAYPICVKLPQKVILTYKKKPRKKENIVWIQKVYILHEFQTLVTVLELTGTLTQFHELLAIGKILFDKTVFNFVSVYNVTVLKLNEKF